MRPVHWLFVLRAASLLAMSTSIALTLDYLSPEMAFCVGGSGCGAVRNSGFGYVILPGVGPFPYLPVLGAMAFAVLFAATLLGDPDKRRTVAAPLAYAGAAGSLALIALQAFVIGQFCSLCVIVDTAALVAAAAAFFLGREGWDQGVLQERERISLVDAHLAQSRADSIPGVWRDDSRVYDAPNPLVQPAPPDPLRLRMAAWIVLFSLSVLAPLAYPRVARTTQAVPSSITELYQPGAVDVVEFFDFQCPHCRSLAPVLHEVVEHAPHSVRLVRKYVPLRGHELSREGSRLALCAGEQGAQKESLVTDALLRGPQLTPQMLEAAARLPQLDQDRLAACLTSSRPDQILEETKQRIQDAGFVGLPTTYVGQFRLLGAQPKELYLDAIERTARGEGTGGVTPWLYWLLVAGLVVATVFFGRVRKKIITSGDALASR